MVACATSHHGAVCIGGAVGDGFVAGGAHAPPCKALSGLFPHPWRSVGQVQLAYSCPHRLSAFILSLLLRSQNPSAFFLTNQVYQDHLALFCVSPHVQRY
jgi:hypothetical protein